MMGLWKKSVRGEFSFTTWFIVLLFVGGIYLTVKFSQAYMDKSKIETILSSAVLQLKEASDSEIKDRIISEAKTVVQLGLTQENLFIFRTEDRKWIRAEAHYVSPIRISGFGWDLSIEAAVTESTVGQGWR